MPQIYDMGPTALLPLRRKACWEFFRSKNPTASAGFEPANLGTKDQHATPIPDSHIVYDNTIATADTSVLLSKNCGGDCRTRCKNTIHFKQRLLPNCLPYDPEIITVIGGDTSRYHTPLAVAEFTGKRKKIKSDYFIATPRMLLIPWIIFFVCFFA